MNVRLLLIPVFVLLLTGCRKDPHMQVYIDNMNAEKRLLEDTLYDLQYDYETKAAEVERLRKEVDDLKSGGSSVLTPGSSSSGAGGSVGDGQGTGGQPRNLFPDIPDLSPPTVEEGTPSSPGGNTIEGGPDMDDLEPPKLDLGEDSGDGAGASHVATPDDRQITNLYLNPAQTGGLQRDNLPGDDGIVVVFEPRNEDSRFVPRTGRVSVVLLDPDSRKRVARWEIDEKETGVALQRARYGQGIKLSMPWNESPPTQSRLHLFVRYWLPDGSTVQGDREITITPNGQLAARWTPRTEQRPARPSRRMNVADNPALAPVESPESGPGADAGNAPQEPVDSPPARQANLPQWRPYR